MQSTPQFSGSQRSLVCKFPSESLKKSLKSALFKKSFFYTAINRMAEACPPSRAQARRAGI
jgi:hypothetical protein